MSEFHGAKYSIAFQGPRKGQDDRKETPAGAREYFQFLDGIDIMDGMDDMDSGPRKEEWFRSIPSIVSISSIVSSMTSKDRPSHSPSCPSSQRQLITFSTKSSGR